ncbi:MAG: DUF4397 domain-containing protein [Gammaproteobacteria bacterium]|nr:DUF4397 domain-containing protein [Gammaproteobacteria bacterium]
MKRTLLLLVCVSTLVLGACTSDSSLPTPTGKGTIRAINAIKGSPEVGFLIEETPLGGVRYKTSTTPQPYDDFSYNFNFEILYPGDTSHTRVATETLQVEADVEHILLLTGDIDAPTVTVWNSDARTFADTDTVFEVRFAHANAILADIDIYFDPPGTLPGTNPPAATLGFGSIGSATDFEEGSYVMTITAAGDPNTVYFTSRETALLPRSARVITVFEGDLSDTAPVVVSSMTSGGGSLAFVDANYPAQTRFVHAASTLETVDIYNDEALTSLVYAGLSFESSTPWLEAPEETTTTYYFTPASSTATVLFDETISAQAPGSFTNIYMIGDTDAWQATRTLATRAPVSNSARIQIYHAALNHEDVDIYVLDRDEPITEDSTASLVNAAYELPAPTLSILARNVDLYVTAPGETTVLAGPYPIDATLGSVYELVLVDTPGDPSTANIIDTTTP